MSHKFQIFEHFELYPDLAGVFQGLGLGQYRSRENEMGTRVDTFVPSLLLTVDALRPALSSFCFLESMKWCTMTWNCGPSSTFALLICPRQCLSQQQGITLSHVVALLNSCSIKKFKDTTGLSSELHSINPHEFSLKTWAVYYKELHTLSSVSCCQVKTTDYLTPFWADGSHASWISTQNTLGWDSMFGHGASSPQTWKFLVFLS